jgi:hypothetical protein
MVLMILLQQEIEMLENEPLYLLTTCDSMPRFLARPTGSSQNLHSPSAERTWM